MHRVTNIMSSSFYTATCTLTLLMIVTLVSFSESLFVMPRYSIVQTFGVTSTCSSILYAKNTNKNKKRLGGPRGVGRRGKVKRDGVPEDEKNKNDIDKASSVPEPSRIRKRIIELVRTEEFPALSVCTVEVDDVEWWGNPENENPYGGRLWPSALAISEFLVEQGSLDGYDVLEN